VNVPVREKRLSDSPEATASAEKKATRRDRRTYRREKITLPAKLFVPSTQLEIECIVTDLSPGGAGFDTPLVPVTGTEIVLYVEGFDRFGGSIAWVSKTGGGIQFSCSEHKRARTAEKIYCYLIGEPIPQTIARSTQRVTLPVARQLSRTNGETASFEVIDISLTGAALRSNSRPAIGETITIGTAKGRVARYVEEGFAVEFTRLPTAKLAAAR
jgi:c-di-GMP-binding flagellar brake protein YcgR